MGGDGFIPIVLRDRPMHNGHNLTATGALGEQVNRPAWEVICLGDARI